MQADDLRVEVGQHRDAADDGLRRNAETDEERENKQIATISAQTKHESKRDDRDCDKHERQKAIAEFDCPVDAHLGCRDEGSLCALGPSGAAEARTRKPHGSARADDEDLSHEGSDRETPDTGIHHSG